MDTGSDIHPQEPRRPEELTGLTDHRARPKLQHHGEQGDVSGVEDLRPVRQVQRPELGRRVQHIHPATTAAGHLGAKRAANEVYRVSQDAVPGLGLGPTLYTYGHHCTMAQRQDGCVTLFDQLLVRHKAHGCCLASARDLLGVWT